MNKTRISTYFSFLLSVTLLSAQQLTPYVVSSSGGFYQNDAGMLSFTTAEMTAVETFESLPSILTQGFQQPYDLGTGITYFPEFDFSYSVYPNPTSGVFNLVTSSDVIDQVTVKILDVLGKEVIRTEYSRLGKIHIQAFDLTAVAQGIYLVVIYVKENSPSTGYHFVSKIHIVK